MKSAPKAALAPGLFIYSVDDQDSFSTESIKCNISLANFKYSWIRDVGVDLEEDYKQVSIRLHSMGNGFSFYNSFLPTA